ncbi:hypothetical protein CEUSTIGMA_g7681.t1 [Chlamydomonas eustigma]|uniref:RING-type domain-containing protein n=1 Tax=Chlamydomonas eustigma TaxID=1157962 RepID=A0A250XAV2_9CHLO|nr:hypothetical protein CEUSTIGMA_g7681.t1 [Chlamydomonas eustigma]|eukprot:GAX80243.1 hypothetical protein CEUSTIGMA_g7681.t1 [Chlamydomonas eustigma]
MSETVYSNVGGRSCMIQDSPSRGRRLRCHIPYSGSTSTSTLLYDHGNHPDCRSEVQLNAVATCLISEASTALQRPSCNLMDSSHSDWAMSSNGPLVPLDNYQHYIQYAVSLSASERRDVLGLPKSEVLTAVDDVVSKCPRCGFVHKVLSALLLASNCGPSSSPEPDAVLDLTDLTASNSLLDHPPLCENVAGEECSSCPSCLTVASIHIVSRDLQLSHHKDNTADDDPAAVSLSSPGTADDDPAAVSLSSPGTADDDPPAVSLSSPGTEALQRLQVLVRGLVEEQQADRLSVFNESAESDDLLEEPRRRLGGLCYDQSYCKISVLQQHLKGQSSKAGAARDKQNNNNGLFTQTTSSQLLMSRPSGHAAAASSSSLLLLLSEEAERRGGVLSSSGSSSSRQHGATAVKASCESDVGVNLTQFNWRHPDKLMLIDSLWEADFGSSSSSRREQDPPDVHLLLEGRAAVCQTRKLDGSCSLLGLFLRKSMLHLQEVSAEVWNCSSHIHQPGPGDLESSERRIWAALQNISQIQSSEAGAIPEKDAERKQCQQRLLRIRQAKQRGLEEGSRKLLLILLRQMWTRLIQAYHLRQGACTATRLLHGLPTSSAGSSDDLFPSFQVPHEAGMRESVDTSFRPASSILRLDDRRGVPATNRVFREHEIVEVAMAADCNHHHVDPLSSKETTGSLESTDAWESCRLRQTEVVFGVPTAAAASAASMQHAEDALRASLSEVQSLRERVSELEQELECSQMEGRSLSIDLMDTNEALSNSNAQVSALFDEVALGQARLEHALNERDQLRSDLLLQQAQRSRSSYHQQGAALTLVLGRTHDYDSDYLAGAINMPESRQQSSAHGVSTLSNDHCSSGPQNAAGPETTSSLLELWQAALLAAAAAAADQQPLGTPAASASGAASPGRERPGKAGGSSACCFPSAQALLSRMNAEELEGLLKRAESAVMHIRAVHSQAVVSEKEACPVCWEAQKGLVFGCGHSTCVGCGEKLSSCPICRSMITIRIRTY